MTRFTATNESRAVVAAQRPEIWRVLTDPAVLPALTPLLRRIDADGDVWRWHLVRVSVLGMGISTTFTERMRFERQRRIDFSHQPPPGRREYTGADGHYLLADAPGGTEVSIKLTVHVDLPLTRAAGPAVSTAMRATMQRTGDRFSANLLRELGVPRRTRNG